MGGAAAGADKGSMGLGLRMRNFKFDRLIKLIKSICHLYVWQNHVKEFTYIKKSVKNY